MILKRVRKTAGDLQSNLPVKRVQKKMKTSHIQLFEMFFAVIFLFLVCFYKFFYSDDAN